MIEKNKILNIKYQLNFAYYDNDKKQFICCCRLYKTLNGVKRFLLKNGIINFVCVDIETLEEVEL